MEERRHLFFYPSFMAKTYIAKTRFIDIYIEKNNNDETMDSYKKLQKTLQIELNPDLEKLKRCSKCKKLLPIENFHHEEKNKDGLKNQCRKCVLDRHRTHLKKPILTEDRYKKIIILAKKRMENEILIKDGFKICNLCNRKLPLSEFTKHKRRLGGISDECSDCISKRGATRYEKNGFTAPERLKEVRRRAKKGKFPCDIDFEFLERKFDEQKGLCFYSKLPMTKEVGKSNTASIDRVQPSNGYTKDNVVLCCDIVNSMKSSMSYETFYDLCKNIVDNKLQITEALKKLPEEKHWRIRASDKMVR